MQRVAVVVLMALGCATPYQRKGFSGGYTDTRLGDGRWMITVGVNSYTSRGTAIQYTYRRAAELCPHGFDPIDADRSSNDFYTSFDGGKTVQNMPKSSATLVVECRSAPRKAASLPPGVGPVDDPSTLPPEHQPKWKPGERPADPAPPAPEKPRARVENGIQVILVDRPFRCFEVDQSGMRMCASNEELCSALAHRLKSLATCEASPRAACYRTLQTVSGATNASCWSTMETCRATRGMSMSDPDPDVTIESECFVMRHEP